MGWIANSCLSSIEKGTSNPFESWRQSITLLGARAANVPTDKGCKSIAKLKSAMVKKQESMDLISR